MFIVFLVGFLGILTRLVGRLNTLTSLRSAVCNVLGEEMFIPPSLFVLNGKEGADIEGKKWKMK